MTFYIEYEVPPMRGIYTEKIHAVKEEQAIEFFEISHPNAKIRKIEGYHQHDF